MARTGGAGLGRRETEMGGPSRSKGAGGGIVCRIVQVHLLPLPAPSTHSIRVSSPVGPGNSPTERTSEYEYQTIQPRSGQAVRVWLVSLGWLARRRCCPRLGCPFPSATYSINTAATGMGRLRCLRPSLVAVGGGNTNGRGKRVVSAIHRTQGLVSQPPFVP